jgi:hypothetical protein
VAHVPGKNEWSWSGRLNRNPHITMERGFFAMIGMIGGTWRIFSMMGDQMFLFTIVIKDKVAA